MSEKARLTLTFSLTFSADNFDEYRELYECSESYVEKAVYAYSDGKIEADVTEVEMYGDSAAITEKLQVLKTKRSPTEALIYGFIAVVLSLLTIAQTIKEGSRRQ